LNKLLNIYNKCTRLPFGNILFSKAICFKAPYFRSIKPIFTKLESGFGEVNIKNKRGVQNHLKSVHAIAMCNMCELVGGSVIEATIPSHLRWIPKEMKVEYLKMAKTELTATCRLEVSDWQESMDLPIIVEVKDTYGVIVLKAMITMYVSLKQ